MKSSRGFISLGLILAIVIGLAVLGGAGYWATNQSPTQQQTENDTTPKTIDTSKSVQVQVQTVEESKTYSAHPLIKAYLQGPSEIVANAVWKGSIVIPQNTIGVAGSPDVTWGDGNADPEWGGSPWSYDSGGSATITHTYTKPGNYTIIIYINGGAGVGFEKGTVVINKVVMVRFVQSTSSTNNPIIVDEGSSVGTSKPVTSTFSIVSPNGGESLKVGRSFIIRWNSDGSTMGGNGNNVVTVSLTPQNLGYKDERQFGIANVKASDLSYTWTPPASLSGDSYRVEATLSDGICVPIGPLPYLGATCMAMANTFATDESDSWFAIQ